MEPKRSVVFLAMLRQQKHGMRDTCVRRQQGGVLTERI